MFAMKDFWEICRWACHSMLNGVKLIDLKDSERKKYNLSEVKWGNKMIKSSKYTTQWTTKLGEELVRQCLILQGQLPVRINKDNKKDSSKPDWITDDSVYEVKARNWTTTGTAGEKVLGSPYKYCRIPKLYGKPLKIICIGY